MAKITYLDKIDRRLVPIPNENKVTAGDLNEIKESVNTVYDGDLDVIENNLSVLPKYQTESDAIADGLIQGNSWFDLTTKTYKSIWNFIQSYTAGVADIDFTNTTTGVDSWDILLKIAPTSLQLSAGESVESYDCRIGFFQGGTAPADIFTGNGIIIDTPITTTLNGAGVYAVTVTYNITGGKNFTINYLIKVDAVGNILASIKNKGNTINSINGLNINYTANIEQVGVSESIIAIAFDGTTLSQVGTGLTGTAVLPIGTVMFANYTTLDPIFWADIDPVFLASPESFNASITVIII